MLVTLKNRHTDEIKKFMSPTMEIGTSGEMHFMPNIGESGYTLYRGIKALVERTANDEDITIDGEWLLVSITDDIAYLWNINDVADVYEENFDDLELAPDKDEAETIIESVGNYDHVNHAVRMAILEEIKITLAEREQS